MVLVFILCTIIILIASLICFIIFSTMHLEIKNFEMTNIPKLEECQDKERKKAKYKIEISLYLFNKIKWFKIRLNSDKLKSLYGKMQLEKIDLKKMEQDLKLEDLKEIKNIKPKISLLNLELKIGTEDVAITSFIIFLISTLISILLPHAIKKYQKDKYKYEIKPLYMNQNIYQIKFDCIFEVKNGTYYEYNIHFFEEKERR